MNCTISLVRYLHNRIAANADHYAVEDPSRVQATEDVSVDILFAAFEKFLRVAWREHMGPLLPANVIWSMQSEFGMSILRDEGDAY